jgi:hypothetical protein
MEAALCGPPYQVGNAGLLTAPLSRNTVTSMSLWRRRWLSLLPLMAMAALIATSASPAGAAVTIGQVDPDPTPDVTCILDADVTQPTVTGGTSYVVPGTGTITSWSHQARAGSGQTFSFKVFRKVADPATYAVVGHDGPRSLTGGVLNTFAGISIPVKPGDVIGVNSGSGTMTACLFGVPGETYSYTTPGLADGQSVPFLQSSDARTNVSAVFTPANTFTLGKAKLKKKKGTATITVDVPNPGDLTGSGKGVKVASAQGAVTSNTVAAPGKVMLTIKAKGKKQNTLNETGKVKVTPKITYTPTGGDPSTQSIKVKLKKKL